MKLLYCVAGIMAANLTWSYFQERVGATDYCNADGTCERFKSIPVMNLVQATAASLVGFLMLAWFGGAPASAKGQPGLTAWDFFPVSLCHTIASPVGYGAMRFIPYPFYMCVSTAKFIPVLVVGWLVNGKTPSKANAAAAAVMLTGIVAYSYKQLAKAHMKHEGVMGLSPAAQLLAGIGVTLVNLSMEGYTNAGQEGLKEVLKTRLGKDGQAAAGTYQYQLMGVMNAWSVVLLSLFLAGQAAIQGEASYLLSALSFAQRHPELLLHIASFSALGAVAQVFIFSCIASHGSFTTTTITVSRKFVTVLLSVALFGHSLDMVQWAGVGAVFTGLGIQLGYGGGGHGHGHGQVEDAKKPKKE